MGSPGDALMAECDAFFFGGSLALRDKGAGDEFEDGDGSFFEPKSLRKKLTGEWRMKGGE